MNPDLFFSYLQKRVQRPLPGRGAQLLMAPSPLNGEKNYKLNPDRNANESSVMILLFPGRDNQVESVLTLRTDTITHGGQISFPGGKSDSGESAKETALRETEEEIGVPKKNISVIGKITPLYLQKSNNLITPFLGIHSSKPEITINPEEVQEAFTISLDKLIAGDHLVSETWELEGNAYKVPYWDIHQVPLWGATAMMLSELLILYREFQESGV